jgi:hypothetical protein
MFLQPEKQKAMTENRHTTTSIQLTVDLKDITTDDLTELERSVVNILKHKDACTRISHVYRTDWLFDIVEGIYQKFLRRWGADIAAKFLADASLKISGISPIEVNAPTMQAIIMYQ